MNYLDLVNNVLPEKRLQSYGSLNPSNLPETVARYLWNMRLCEALYPALNGLEVALRTRVHRELSQKTKYHRWMDPNHNLLAPRDLDQVKQAIARLSREGRSTGVDQLIASLTLGFWVGLFSVRYERKFWMGHSLRGVFPNAPKAELGCHLVRFKLYRIKHLRNWVFHHEPIWQWKDLDHTYEDIVKLTLWLNRDWASLVHSLDRFPAVNHDRNQPLLAQR